jgi:hypothetical protein
MEKLGGTLPQQLFVIIWRWVKEHGPFYINGVKCYNLRTSGDPGSFPNVKRKKDKNGVWPWPWTVYIKDELIDMGILPKTKSVF